MVSLRKLKSIKQKIHRGKILEEKVKATHISKEAIARRADYSRNAYYLHINNPDLPDPILIKYGKALNYDFSQDIPDLEQQLMEESVADYTKEPETLEEAKQQINYWRFKYYTTLDKYNTTLDKYIDAIEKKK